MLIETPTEKTVSGAATAPHGESVRNHARAQEFQFAVGEHFELTPRFGVYSEEEYDTKDHWEIRADTSDLRSKNFPRIGQWYSQFDWGGGLRVRF